MRQVRIAALALFLLVVIACETVPISGRSHLILLPEGTEMQMGIDSYREVLKKSQVSGDAAARAQVERVGRRIADATGRRDYQWEFNLIEDKQVNAFCLPGGKVAVYTGILPITSDEGGLATVIGHEVSHAVARHGAERLSEGLLVQFGGQLLGEAMKDRSNGARDLALQAYGIGSAVGVGLPHSRQQESEADHLGLIYMARAGYAPRQAVEFWKRFASYNSRQGSRPIAFLSTHPVDDVRIRQLDAELPQALAEYEKAGRRISGQ